MPDYLESAEGKEWIDNPRLNEKWSGNHDFR